LKSAERSNSINYHGFEELTGFGQISEFNVSDQFKGRSGSIFETSPEALQTPIKAF